MATAQPPLTSPTTFSFGHAGVREEHLVELRLAGDHLDRADLDARLVHRAQQERDALVLRRVRVGAAQDEDPVREVAGRRPDLLAVDDPLVAVEHRSGTEVAEIAAGARFAVPLTPTVVAGQDPRDEVLLLLVGPPVEQRVADHADREHVVHDPARHAGLARTPRRGSPARAPSIHRRRTPSASSAPGSRARAACVATPRRTPSHPRARAHRRPSSHSGGAPRGTLGSSRGRRRPQRNTSAACEPRYCVPRPRRPERALLALAVRRSRRARVAYAWSVVADACDRGRTHERAVTAESRGNDSCAASELEPRDTIELGLSSGEERFGEAERH